MQVKLGLIIVSLVLCAFQSKRLVFIQGDNPNAGLYYDEAKKEVNLYIDSKLIADCSLQKQIKLFLAYQYVKNKSALEKGFIKRYHMGLNRFASLHRKQISTVIYYLESSEHGNLPVIYHMEAYDLLDLTILKPEITKVKKRLDKGGMLLIDVVEDSTQVIRLDTMRIKNK